MVDYSVYQWECKELFLELAKAIILTSMIGYLFYRSIWGCIAMCPIAWQIVKERKKKWIEERRWILTLEFKEVLLHISASLGTGYSIENAIVQTTKEIGGLLEKDAYMIAELETMVYRLKRNETIESIFLEFANRAKTEEITNFVDVFLTAKRTGGDLIKIIAKTSQTISDKVEVQQEIRTVITAKQLEGKIMSIVPIGIIFYLWVTSPGYLDQLYHNVVGIILMTVLLGAYGLAYYLMQRILNIKV